MRVVHVTILAAAVLLVGGVASAQGIGEVAAREKQRRQSEDTEAKVYTEDDLGPSMAPVAVPGSAPASSETESTTEDEAEGQEASSTADDQAAQAEAAWRQKLEQARKEAQVYQEVIDELQLELNDTSGLYSPGRASKIAFLEENQQRLAETQQRIAALEAEGRREGYR